MTAPMPNPWITDPVAPPSVATDTAAAPSPMVPPCDAAAEPIPVSPGACLESLPSGEIDPSVMLDFAPGENLPATSTGGHQEAPAVAPPHVATAGLLEDLGYADDICHVHEIFYHARKMIAEDKCFAEDEHRFVLNVAAFEEAIEELPLFLRQRRA